MEQALGIVLLLIAGVVYGLLCRWVAEYANAKGYSYWGVALFSLFATPLWGFVFAALAPERKGAHRVSQRNRT